LGGKVFGFENSYIMLYSGIAIIIVVAIVAILLMKKKNNKSEITESTSGQEFIFETPEQSERPEQSAAKNNISAQNEKVEEENFSVPVSAEEEKLNDDFNVR